MLVKDLSSGIITTSQINPLFHRALYQQRNQRNFDQLEFYRRQRQYGLDHPSQRIRPDRDRFHEDRRYPDHQLQRQRDLGIGQCAPARGDGARQYGIDSLIAGRTMATAASSSTARSTRGRRCCATTSRRRYIPRPTSRSSGHEYPRRSHLYRVAELREQPGQILHVDELNPNHLGVQHHWHPTEPAPRRQISLRNSSTTTKSPADKAGLFYLEESTAGA